MRHPLKAKNSIDNRLDYLTTQWNRFASNSKSRLLRWMVDEDGARMLDVFFEVQSEDVLDIPDLFVRLNTPCESSNYPQALVEEFLKQYLDDRDALKEEGIDAEWRPPDMPPVCSGVDTLVECAISFQRYYSEAVSLLVLVLTPSGIGDTGSWSSVLYELARRLPACVRVTVDRAEVPLLDRLAAIGGELITTLTPDLDMPGAILQLANEEGRTGPGVDFRRRFLELAQIVPAGDLATMRPKAEAAIEIAKKQNWISLQFAVQMLVAAGHCNAGRSQHAVESYRVARETAERAQSVGDPAGGKLVLQARLGEAAALLQQGAYADAAQIYEGSVKLASETEQPLLELGCKRMAAYCYEHAGTPHAAWETLWSALALAGTWDESTRKQSTLPYAGEALLRLTEKSKYKVHTGFVHERMTALLGHEWRATVATGSRAV